jgi:hypothetical protein
MPNGRSNQVDCLRMIGSKADILGFLFSESPSSLEDSPSTPWSSGYEQLTLLPLCLPCLPGALLARLVSSVSRISVLNGLEVPETRVRSEVLRLASFLELGWHGRRRSSRLLYEFLWPHLGRSSRIRTARRD